MPKKFELNQQKIYIENAKGDGNCSFNSFILGLCQPDVLESIEAQLHKDGLKPDDIFHKFIPAAARALKCEGNWASLKQRLLSTDRQTLQVKLAPIFRNLAIDLASKDPEHRESTIQPLLAAFNNHISNRPIPAGQRDDIFQGHPFILAKFKELKNQPNRENELQTWWAKKGFNQFLREMRKDAVWAGDLELKQLARFFRVNLTVLRGRDNQTHSVPIYEACGSIPIKKEGAYSLDKKTINQLVADNVIDKPHDDDPQLNLRIKTFDQVQSILATIEAGDRVKDTGAILEAWETNYKQSATITLSNIEGLHFNTVVNPPANTSTQHKPRDLKNNTLKKQTLALMAADNQNVHFDEKKWESLVQAARNSSINQPQPSTTSLIVYSVFNSLEEISVSKEMQIQLDEEYAKKLQEEEYQACRQRNHR